MKLVFAKKISEYLIAFIFIITINFFIPRLMPGDPFTFLSSDNDSVVANYDEQQLQKYKAYYKLDKPLKYQYIEYVKNTFKGYFGYSIIIKDSVSVIIKDRILYTVLLVFISTIISAIIGTILGCISAYNKNKKVDNVFYFIFIVISEIPSFLIGLLFLFYFSAYLGLFPLAGSATSFANYSSKLEYILDLIHHFSLPVITLSFVNLGGFYLLSRNSMLLVLSKDYMVTAKAKGLNKNRILFYHALKNAILPIITRIFLNFGYIIGGAILIENVFKYPGIGMLLKEAVFNRDYPLIQGIFLILAVTVLTMNLIADIIYKKLDPRLR